VDVAQIDKTASHWERLAEHGWDMAFDLATTWGLKLAGAVALLFIGYFAARMVRSAMVRAGRRAPHVDITVVSFIASLVKYAILALTIVAVLSNFGVQTNSVVAVIGAAGLAIGLALQGTLGHVASGFMLIMFRPFRVGDTVETAGVTGVVTEVSLFTTEINSPDNMRIVIPNSSVWSGVTKNLTTNQTRRCDVDVLVAPDNDIDQVLKIIGDVVAKDERILPQPAPLIGVIKQSEVGVRVTCQVWCKSTDLGPLQLSLYRAVLAAFAANDLLLMPPVPPRTPAPEAKPA
jgi:small conductance mechanosensitive channel